MAFTLYQTWQLPRVVVDSVASRPLGNGLTEVTAIVSNSRVVPTHTQQDTENRISRPDYITLTGPAVIAGYRVLNPPGGGGGGFFGFGGGGPSNEGVEQKRNPARLEIANIPGNGSVVVKWVVRGAGPYTVTVDSEKGGTASLTGR
jgi:hypothetical protein